MRTNEKAVSEVTSDLKKIYIIKHYHTKAQSYSFLDNDPTHSNQHTHTATNTSVNAHSGRLQDYDIYPKTPSENISKQQ